jgi:hypothetical protein
MPPRLGRRLGAAAALCAVALTTCRFPTAPPLPDGARDIEPPAVYARWWAMTEACSGVTGHFENVNFFEVPGVSDFVSDGRRVVGYWTNGGNRIVLAEEAVLDGGSVRHEMLHALIRIGGHPRDQFLDKCAGVVDCGTSCIADAGAAPAADPAALSVSPLALAVTTEVTPMAPTSARDGGFFLVGVTVRNTLDRPVIARLGPTNARALSFQYDVRGPTGGTVGARIVLDASSVAFAPGEAKRQYFDFAIGNDLPARRLPPGEYTVVGAYGSHRSDATAVTVGP